LLLAIVAAQMIRSSLYATKSLDPAVFAGVIGLLFGVATTGYLWNGYSGNIQSI